MSIAKARKSQKEEKSLTVLILGSSHNTRLRNCGAKSCLVMPDSRYLINHQLDIIKRYNPQEIFMTIGYDADRVIERNFGLKLIENQIYKETGEAEDLRLFFNLHTPERLLIVSGDLYLRLAIVGDTQYTGSWCVGSDGTDNKDEIGFSSEFDIINGFSYIFRSKFSGLIMLEGLELELMKRYLNRETTRCATWEILEGIIKKGASIKPIHVPTNRLVKLHGIRDLNSLKNNFT